MSDLTAVPRENEVRMAIQLDQTGRLVVLHFGAQLSALALTKDQAISFVTGILEKVSQIKTSPIVMPGQGV